MTFVRAGRVGRPRHGALVAGTDKVMVMVMVMVAHGDHAPVPTNDGPLSPALADTEATPLARANSVTFDGTAWTRDISHGEMIRNGIDRTPTIGPRNLRCVYQCMAPGATDFYTFLPWRLGLLTPDHLRC